jgi:cytochrome bd-type quinol oxidase subunit 2
MPVEESRVRGSGTHALALLLGLAVGVSGLMLRLPTVSQTTSYHEFADQRSWLGIPNFFNVASNLLFVVVGIAGMAFTWRAGAEERHFIDARERWPYFWLFVGVFLTGFGSACYHLAPDNGRLVWDRLPMTIAFASLVAALVAERISARWGLRLLPWLILYAAGTVVLWYHGEVQGHGDLRLYAGVQAFSALALLAAAVLPSPYSRRQDFAIAFGCYFLAKIVETADHLIFRLGHLISGHTLKHVASAAAAYFLWRMLRIRQPQRLGAVTG